MDNAQHKALGVGGSEHPHTLPNVYQTFTCGLAVGGGELPAHLSPFCGNYISGRFVRGPPRTPCEGQQDLLSRKIGP